MNVLAAGYRAANPSHVDAPSRIEVVSLLDDAVGEQRQSYLMLFGAVACVLLIACANIANLLLARAIGRRHELSVRLALGASRWQIGSLLVAESVMLAAGGAMLGNDLGDHRRHHPVERAGRLVKQPELGRLHQEPREIEPPPLPGREKAGRNRAEPPDAEAIERRLRGLGATAAQSLLGAGFRVTKQRGEMITDTKWAPFVTATYHPSAILRQPDEASRKRVIGEFREDIAKVAKQIQELRRKGIDKRESWSEHTALFPHAFPIA